MVTSRKSARKTVDVTKLAKITTYVIRCRNMHYKIGQLIIFVFFFFRNFRYEKAIIAMAKQSVTLELLSYHASASLEDAQRLKVSVEGSKKRVAVSSLHRTLE